MPTQYFYNPDLFTVRKPEPAVKLWRYMDLPKFISMLSRKALFFCRLDLFDDPFEGSMPRALVRRRSDRQESDSWIVRAALHYDDSVLVHTRRRNTIVNCWHAGEYESAAMWSLYAQDNQGLAIRSTFERMTTMMPPSADSVPEFEADSLTPKVLHIGAGLVEYIDFSDDRASLVVQNLAFYKRRSFEHENELRMAGVAYPYMGDPTEESSFPGGGDYVPVDLERLIEAVFVAPQAPGWFNEVVRSVMERYKFSCEVQQSSLGQDPVF